MACVVHYPIRKACRGLLYAALSCKLNLVRGPSTFAGLGFEGVIADPVQSTVEYLYSRVESL
jgi:hypothetical protein